MCPPKPGVESDCRSRGPRHHQKHREAQRPGDGPRGGQGQAIEAVDGGGGRLAGLAAPDGRATGPEGPLLLEAPDASRRAPVLSRKPSPSSPRLSMKSLRSMSSDGSLACRTGQGVSMKSMWRES